MKCAWPTSRLVAVGIITLSGLLPAILSCGPRDLTREEAKHLLDSDPHFTPSASLMYNLHVSVYGSAGCEAPADGKFPRTVEKVTGITIPPASQATQRIVEFSWTWNLTSLSPATVKCLQPGSGGQATALFQLYDDGWRVVEVTCPWCSNGAG